MLEYTSSVSGWNPQRPPPQSHHGDPQVSQDTAAEKQKVSKAAFSCIKSVNLSDRTIVGYKHTWMLGKRYSMNVSYKIFCGWDFTIQDPASAALKSSFIRNDLKVNGRTLIAAFMITC